jgi:hypothetical protein
MEERAYFDLIRQTGFEEIRIVADILLPQRNCKKWPLAQAQNSHHVQKKRILSLCKGR